MEPLAAVVKLDRHARVERFDDMEPHDAVVWETPQPLWLDAQARVERFDDVKPHDAVVKGTSQGL